MTNLQYMLYSFAAALIKAGESLKDSADNVPAGVGNGAPDDDGVIDGAPDDDGVIDGAENTSGETYVPPAFDSTGLPWDARIHSGGKSTKADGTWTKKKGVADTTVASVTAELRAAAGAAGAAPVVGTPPAAPLGVQLPAVGGLAVPGAIAPPALTKYQQLVAYLAAKTGPGKAADDAWVNAAFTGWGLTLAGMATDEANAALVLAEFKKVLGE